MTDEDPRTQREIDAGFAYHDGGGKPNVPVPARFRKPDLSVQCPECNAVSPLRDWRAGVGTCPECDRNPFTEPKWQDMQTLVSVAESNLSIRKDRMQGKAQVVPPGHTEAKARAMFAESPLPASTTDKVRACRRLGIAIPPDVADDLLTERDDLRARIDEALDLYHGSMGNCSPDMMARVLEAGDA